MSDENKKLDQEKIENFKDGYATIISSGMEIAQVIDEKNPDLKLAETFAEGIDESSKFNDVCNLMCSYDVEKNAFSNEDLYQQILHITEASQQGE